MIFVSITVQQTYLRENIRVSICWKCILYGWHIFLHKASFKQCSQEFQRIFFSFYKYSHCFGMHPIFIPCHFSIYNRFFHYSGLLVTLLFLRGKNSTKSSKDTSFITGAKHSVFLVIYRYIRLTPVYFMVIIINAVTLKWVYFNHGNEIIFSHFNKIKLEYSRWWNVKLLIFHSNNFCRYVYNAAVFTPGLPDHVTCPNYWWRNILYIQTWFPFPQLCMLWSWYLADDMQFYVWAIVVLIFSKRYVSE